MRFVSVGSRSIAVPRGGLTQPNAILRPRRGYRCQSERLKLFRNGGIDRKCRCEENRLSASA